MGTIFTIIAGLALAGVTTVGLVSVQSDLPGGTSAPTTGTSAPVVYGDGQ